VKPTVSLNRETEGYRYINPRRWKAPCGKWANRCRCAIFCEGEKEREREREREKPARWN